MNPLQVLIASHAVGTSLRALIAALHGDSVAETGTTWVLVGSDFKIHLTDSLVDWRAERTELCTGARGGLHGLIDNLQVAAICEFQVSLDRISPWSAFC